MFHVLPGDLHKVENFTVSKYRISYSCDILFPRIFYFVSLFVCDDLSETEIKDFVIIITGCFYVIITEPTNLKLASQINSPSLRLVYSAYLNSICMSGVCV